MSNERNKIYIMALKFTDGEIANHIEQLERQHVEQVGEFDEDWLWALRTVRDEREIKANNQLHLHVWPREADMADEQWDGDPDEEVDLKWSGSYPNMVEPKDMKKYGNDGYYQFSGDLSDGRSIELRIPLDTNLQRMDPIDSPTRHPEDRLNGVVEAALNHCMEDEEFLRSCAEDIGIDKDGDGFDMPSKEVEVWQAMESYICNHLARK